MFRRCWIVVVLCFGTVALAQSSPELEKIKSDARAAYEQHDLKRANELISRVISQNPRDSAALNLRAKARVEMGVDDSISDKNEGTREIREGIEDARESLKIGGSDISYYLPYFFGMVSLARIENKKEHANVVIEHTTAVLAKSNVPPEQRADILYQRASAYIFLQDLKSAINDFQAAIKAFPGHLGSYMSLADAYIFSGQRDKALSTFNSAVEAFPNSPLAFNNRGLFLQREMERYAESINDFNKAIELDKDFAIAYVNRGFSNQWLGNLQLAEVDYNQAITLQSQNAMFHSLRGNCRLSQGNLNGALEDFNDAVRLYDQNAVSRSDVGFAKFFMKDYMGASAEFETANQMNPELMRYLAPWRVWSLTLAGKPEAAAPIIALSSAKSEAVRDWIDEQVLFLGRKDVSERDLVDFVSKATDAKTKSGELCEAYFFIGETRSQANDKKNANEFYKQVLATKATHLNAYRGAQFALQTFGR